MENDIEATSVIQDLESNLVQYVRKCLAEKVKPGSKPLLTWRGANVYKFGDDETGYIVGPQ